MSSNLRKIYSLEKKGKRAWWLAHMLNYLSITFFMVEKLAGFLFPFMGLGHRWRTSDTVSNDYQVTAVRPKNACTVEMKTHPRSCECPRCPCGLGRGGVSTGAVLCPHSQWVQWWRAHSTGRPPPPPSVEQCCRSSLPNSALHPRMSSGAPGVAVSLVLLGAEVSVNKVLNSYFLFFKHLL